MNLTAGDIATTPPEGAQGYIGMPTWLWVPNTGESTTGPIIRSASAGSVTVTATATLDRIVYDMGDGTTVTCQGDAAPGTPYDPAVDADNGTPAVSPTCGHMYQDIGQFTIAATSYWTVEWSGAGAAGTIPIELTRSRSHEVGEVQVIVTQN